MTDISSLAALLDLLRAKGVQVYEHEGTKILLGPMPTATRSPISDTLPPQPSRSVAEARDVETNGRDLTDEEILFASSRGWPDETESKQ